MNKGPEPQRRALGKGLSALLPARTAPLPPVTPASTAAAPKPAAEPARALQGVAKVAIVLIDPNPLQPRTIFEPDRLAELAQSIRVNGIIQPLVVTQKGSRYQLVAGERRWRAARLAELLEVPVVVQEFADDRLLEIALIENIQREDLNPIEVAQALERLATEYALSHEELGRRTGKDRATVTNLLRLLRLPQAIQLLLAEHRLSMGHARAILGLPTEQLQIEVAEKAAAQGMSVRQVERHVKDAVSQRESPEPRLEPAADPNVAAAIRELESALGTRVRIVPLSEKRGRIEIEYYSPDDLDRIYNSIVREEKT
jgi:ParB family transcriptional regulator, chromosome partitioning protein